VIALAAFGFYFATNSDSVTAESAVIISPPAIDAPKVSGPMQTAVLAGGCFWGVQAVYQHVQGVQNVLAGYSGGDKSTAIYETVSEGKTGHAESVQIRFDPKEVTYGQLLQVYFSVVHDPTQRDRQGPDKGTQYRSNIFYVDEMQKKIATSYIAQLDKSKVFGGAIATRVDPLKGFYVAETYHQDFLIKNPTQPYIVKYDIPKVQKFKTAFPSLFRGQPTRADIAK